jgi:hypothetical protein
MVGVMDKLLPPHCHEDHDPCYEGHEDVSHDDTKILATKATKDS